jgi:NFU1 iron-sulfur cluster scaffold homolog, mitochondrial
MTTKDDNQQTIEEKIISLIEERVQPSVALDGGRVVFSSFDAKEGVVYVEMQGACKGCPHASITLEDGVKRVLEYYIPEVKDVREV